MEVQNFELEGTDSICPPPEFQLVDLVKSNKVSKITSLVSENPDLLNLIIGHPFNKPILYIACHNFASMVSVGTIKALLDLGANLYHSDELHDHKKAIHFAALGQNPQILKVIVDALSGDELDSTSLGNTALNLLIKYGDAESQDFLRCVKVLVQSDLDVNKTDAKNKSAIFWAARKNYKSVVNIILTKSKQKVRLNKFVCEYLQSNDYLLHVLFGYIKINDEDSFVRCLRGLVDFFDANDGESTFLQLATERHLKRAVEALLDQGVDPNKNTTKRQAAPVEIAVEHGFHKILEIFLKLETLTLPGTILIKCLKHIEDDLVDPKIDHNKCYELLINCKNLNVNAKNEFKTTALHYAAKYGGAEKTLDLLRKGASMASRNKYQALPIEDIDPNVLETHFNECVEVNLDPKMDKDNLTATFNYKTLMPPSKYKNKIKKDDVEAANALLTLEHQLTSETRVLSYMSKSQDLRHLLKHPLITSFLYMKWHRIRWFFYSNLAFYVSFCLSLILYIFLVYDKNDEQSIFLSAYLCATSIVLILRELFQIFVSPKSYFLDLENYLVLVLVILAFLILFQRNLSNNVKRQIAAVVILLAAFELMFLIGQHPKMTTYIVMLRTVSFDFFKFLLWYSILITAFSLSFYILFKKEEQSSSKDDEKFFVNPALSLFKTVVMLTGELDTSNIDFQTHQITSHLIFMLFVFVIAIVLFNLLNGLAISDTQIIRSNAELLGYIARIEHIGYIESMFLFLAWLLTPCSVVKDRIGFSIINNFKVSAILIGRINLFPFYLKDYKLTIFPNQHSKVAIKESDYYYIEQKMYVTSCYNIYLDQQTAKRTKELIKVKNEQEVQRHLLIHHESMVEEQRRIISELRHEQKIILNQLEYIMENMTKQK